MSGSVERLSANTLKCFSCRSDHSGAISMMKVPNNSETTVASVMEYAAQRVQHLRRLRR